jgi:hypothetical protein
MLVSTGQRDGLKDQMSTLGQKAFSLSPTDVRFTPKSGRRNRTDTPNLSSEIDNGWIPLFRGGTFPKENTEKSKTNFGDGARGGSHTDEANQ